MILISKIIITNIEKIISIIKKLKIITFIFLNQHFYLYFKFKIINENNINESNIIKAFINIKYFLIE